MDKVNAERVPDWYGAVVLYFPTTVPIERLEAALSGPLKINTYYDIAETMEITYQEVKSLHSWDVSDMLAALFAKCDLRKISAALAEFNGNILIDLSFHHYEKYPSLLFSGEHMKTIHMLGADLSIDPY